MLEVFYLKNSFAVRILVKDVFLKLFFFSEGRFSSMAIFKAELLGLAFVNDELGFSMYPNPIFSPYNIWFPRMRFRVAFPSVNLARSFVSFLTSSLRVSFSSSVIS